MAVIHRDEDCVYLGGDSRLPDECFAKPVEALITSEEIVLNMSDPKGQLRYPREAITACRIAKIDWTEYMSADLQVTKSRHGVVCELVDETGSLPDDCAVQIGFRNPEYAKTFANRLQGK